MLSSVILPAVSRTAPSRAFTPRRTARAVLRAFVLLAAALLLAACALIPVTPPNKRSGRVQLRAYCRQAAEQGWCSDACGNRQPVGCDPLTLVSCGNLFCTATDSKGNLFFIPRWALDGR
jgi:hypothetical protein